MAGIFAGMCFGIAMKTSRTLTKSLTKRFQQPRARLDGLPETIALSAARGCIFANVRTKAMDQQTQTDQQFLTMANLITAKHGGTIDIDFATRTVNFNVPAENEEACAMELSKVFEGSEI
jgi:hypothetical protein